jgi:hypothetical protein
MKARSALGLAFFGKSPSLPMRCMWHRMPTRRIRGYSVRRKSIRAGWSRQGSGYLFGIGHFAFRHRFGFGFEVAASPAVWSAVHDHGGWLSVRFASLVLEDIASDNATLILIGRGFGRFGTMPHCPVWARSNRTHPFPSSGGGIGVTDLDCRISQSGGPGVQRQQCWGGGPPETGQVSFRGLSRARAIERLSLRSLSGGFGRRGLGRRRRMEFAARTGRQPDHRAHAATCSMLMSRRLRCTPQR